MYHGNFFLSYFYWFHCCFLIIMAILKKLKEQKKSASDLCFSSVKILGWCATSLKHFIFEWLHLLSCNLSVIKQKGESQNGCFKKTKHAKFSEKRIFLTPQRYHLLMTASSFFQLPKNAVLGKLLWLVKGYCWSEFFNLLYSFYLHSKNALT